MKKVFHPLFYNTMLLSQTSFSVWAYSPKSILGESFTMNCHILVKTFNMDVLFLPFIWTYLKVAFNSKTDARKAQIFPKKSFLFQMGNLVPKIKVLKG